MSNSILVQIFHIYSPKIFNKRHVYFVSSLLYSNTNFNIVKIFQSAFCWKFSSSLFARKPSVVIFAFQRLYILYIYMYMYVFFYFFLFFAPFFYLFFSPPPLLPPKKNPYYSQSIPRIFLSFYIIFFFF